MAWQSELLAELHWIVHATSSRADGSLRYPNADETEDPWQEARKRFVSGLGMDPNRLVVSGNRHDKSVAYVTLLNSTMGRIDGVDGLVTDTTGIVLGVKTADCMPIFVVDPKKRLVGLFHAGWKGVEAGMPSAAIHALTARESKAGDLLIAIGPSIRSCHYQRSLQDEAVEQLMRVGVLPEHIDASAPCTACHLEKYFSYHLSRVSGESMLSVITIHN